MSIAYRLTEDAAGEELRVAQEAFSGPISLLVHLAQADRVDLEELALAEVARQSWADLNQQAASLPERGEVLRLLALLVRRKAEGPRELFADDAVDEVSRGRNRAEDVALLRRRERRLLLAPRWRRRGVRGKLPLEALLRAAARRPVVRVRAPRGRRPLAEIRRELLSRLAREDVFRLHPRALPRGERAAVVLALLVLAAEGGVAIHQAAPFEPLEVRRRMA